MAKRTNTPAKSARTSQLSISRRNFIKGVGVGAGTTTTGSGLARSAHAAGGKLGPKPVRVSLSVNGKKQTLAVEPRVTLLRALRNHLDVTGPKEVCDRGACGGCSVLVDGKLVNSCMTLALDIDGKTVQTVEGLAGGKTLSPLQEAFAACDALQCGFCTPGFLMASQALLNRNPGRELSLDEIKEGLSGNICRCGTYNRIFAAVAKVSAEQAKG